MCIKVGAPAPDAAADYWIRGAHGPRRMTLAEHRGKWLVLFFYPRDFTFICPTELVAFGELEADFKAEEAVVIGASTDSFFSHKAWFESDPRLLRVNYPVLADTSHQLSKGFNVLLDDGASLRGTFIIDPQGVVRHITVNDLDVGRNVEETLRVLRALRSGELCPRGMEAGRVDPHYLQRVGRPHVSAAEQGSFGPCFGQSSDDAIPGGGGCDPARG